MIQIATKLYKVYNGPMVTTSPPAKVATGISTLTLLQLKTGVRPIDLKEFGISFDGDAAAEPGVVEVIETGTIAATIAEFVAQDIQPYNDPNAPASSLAIGTTTSSGYTASAEGSITTSRSLDTQLIAPTGQYVKQFVLGDEPEIAYNGHIVRVRVTFPTTVNALAYLIWEEL